MSTSTLDEGALLGLADTIGSAVRDLLAAHGLQVRVLEGGGGAHLAEDDLVAVLPFGSAMVFGKLVLAASQAVLVRTLPRAPPSGGDREAARDWVGELANQALGILRERVVWQGGELVVGTPIVVPLSELPEGELDPERTVGRTLVGTDAHILAWCEVSRGGVRFDSVGPSRAGTRLF